MGFRADNKETYSRWRSKNRYRLVKAGIPQEIVEDDRRFWIVVQEGEDLGHTGWDTTWIGDEEAAELLSLLDEFLGKTAGWDLLFVLRKRLGAEEPPV